MKATEDEQIKMDNEYADPIIEKINAILPLEDDEKKEIKEILLYHWPEPSVSAYDIARLLNTDRHRIYQLL
jgi:hypothetical protein